MTAISLRTAGQAAVTLVLIASVILAVLVAVPGAVGAEGTYVVRSGSMAPAIQPGDLVVVGAVDPADIRRGDVITFERNARATADGRERVTHRVVAIDDTAQGLQFHTKGDANEERDSQPVVAADVVGQVRFTIPLAGWVVAFAGTTLGRILLLVVPGVLLMLSEISALLTADPDTR